MKILIYSPAFHPGVGGIETLVQTLAREFAREGHEVKVVSLTPAASADDEEFPFEVVRGPGRLRLLRLVRWCEVYFQPNVSLRGLWPLAFAPRPWVVSHNNWYARPGGRLIWRDRLKHLLARKATGISVSRAVAAHVAGAPSVVIPNAYREDVFRLRPSVERNVEMVFVGRLVSDKGADLLLDALAQLKTRGLAPRLTIVGGGPEQEALRRQAEELGVADRVRFAGVRRGEELAQLLNAHRVMVVPSRWDEPFGIVALEGIACGCAVVGSEGGGLPDAIGPCGVTFPNNDAAALARALDDLLTNDAKLASLRAGADAHLARHRPREVARAYLKVFEQALRGGSRKRVERRMSVPPAASGRH
ncbi:MAG TPA: glycosyltransferase family 4 protein [Pyrinomonadaceae bacterium]|nr:glycosyltransferase family 4 protein [Pyrinomonadaceae bacterium]